MHIKRKIKEYWDSRSKSYDKSPRHSLLPEIWKDVLGNVFDGSRMKILDVGCGTGFISLILAELGHDVVGLDISRGMLEVAIEKAKKRRLNVQFKLGDAENLPFKDNSFDAVICRHLIWTLPNPKKAISEFARVSKHKVVIIDGKWMDKSLIARFRRSFGRLLISLYERRNPFRNFHYRRDINESLPFYGGTKPETIVEMFKEIGLKPYITDLSWIRDLLRKDLPIVYKIAWGKREYFMIEGVKSSPTR
jgi:ubiquinone/menaquinone biosynthesis C-methylase UbiE